MSTLLGLTQHQLCTALSDYEDKHKTRGIGISVKDWFTKSLIIKAAFAYRHKSMLQQAFIDDKYSEIDPIMLDIALYFEFKIFFKGK